MRIARRRMLAFVLVVSSFAPGTAAGAGRVAQPAGEVHITVAAVGDLLINRSVLDSAYDARDGTFDFSPIFTATTPYLRAADYSVANLETRLAGPAYGYSGYPRFNTPDSLAPAVRRAGIKLLATANNHSLDMGWPGIVHTLQTLSAAGLAHIGTYASAAAQARPFIVDVQGIKLAWLNYTAVTNGLPLPPGKRFALNVWNPQAAATAIRRARRDGADLVLVVMHWGIEDQRTPNAVQRRIAGQLAADGADVVIGSHPHVVQKIATVTATEANGSRHRCLVAYSLGNFIADQQQRYTDCGIILYLDIVKDRAGTRVAQVRYLPVWVEKRPAGETYRFRVLPVLSAAAVAADRSLSRSERSRMLQAWTDTTALLRNPALDIRPLGTRGAKGR